MKQLTTILTILFMSSSLLAQDKNSDSKTKFIKSMKSTLLNLSEAKTSEDYQTVANKLERIGQVETEQWEPIYYLALVKSIQAFEAKDKAAAASELADLAPRLMATLELKSAVDNNAAKSEIHTLMAMMCTARMMENPMTLAAKFGPMRDEHLARAESFNSKNPRLWLLQAQNLFYTPEAFGGDKNKASLLAKKALKLFEAQQKLEEKNGGKSIMPSWGKDQVQSLIKRDNQEEGSAEEK